MVALQFAACTRNGKAVILIVIASNTHIQDTGKRLKNHSMEIVWTFLEFDSKIFRTLKLDNTRATNPSWLDSSIGGAAV